MHLVQAIINHDQSEKYREKSILNTNNMTAEVTNGEDSKNNATPVPQSTDKIVEQSPTIETTPVSSTEEDNKVDEKAVSEDQDDDDDEEESEAELEARAIAEATASADASYTPPVSLLNSSSPYPLIRSVDGMSLKKYNPAPSVFTARGVPVPLRGVLNVPIHVTIGGSVVDYTVESKDFDIEFGVVAEREEGVTVVSVSIFVEYW